MKCHVVLQMQSKRLPTMTIIFFSALSSLLLTSTGTPHFAQQLLIVAGVINLQATAVKCTADSTSTSYSQHHGAVHHLSRWKFFTWTVFHTGNWMHVWHPNIKAMAGWYNPLTATTFTFVRNVFLRCRTYWSIERRIYEFLANFPD